MANTTAALHKLQLPLGRTRICRNAARFAAIPTRCRCPTANSVPASQPEIAASEYISVSKSFLEIGRAGAPRTPLFCVSFAVFALFAFSHDSGFHPPSLNLHP